VGKLEAQCSRNRKFLAGGAQLLTGRDPVSIPKPTGLYNARPEAEQAADWQGDMSETGCSYRGRQGGKSRPTAGPAGYDAREEDRCKHTWGLLISKKDGKVRWATSHRGGYRPTAKTADGTQHGCAAERRPRGDATLVFDQPVGVFERPRAHRERCATQPRALSTASRRCGKHRFG